MYSDRLGRPWLSHLLITGLKQCRRYSLLAKNWPSGHWSGVRFRFRAVGNFEWPGLTVSLRHIIGLRVINPAGLNTYERQPPLHCLTSLPLTALAGQTLPAAGGRSRLAVRVQLPRLRVLPLRAVLHSRPRWLSKEPAMRFRQPVKQ